MPGPATASQRQRAGRRGWRAPPETSPEETAAPVSPGAEDGSDGRCTAGLAIEKTNWANPLDAPPFHAYHVTTGVTFTFGGLKISRAAEVEDLIFYLEDQ